VKEKELLVADTLLCHRPLDEECGDNDHSSSLLMETASIHKSHPSFQGGDHDLLMINDTVRLMHEERNVVLSLKYCSAIL